MGAVNSRIPGAILPAESYALRSGRVLVKFPNKFLYRRIQSDQIKTALSPPNWFKLAGTSFGRSDLAAEFYDREVFGGGTCADVIAQHKRPFGILNATDVTTGAQFPFMQDHFYL